MIGRLQFKHEDKLYTSKEAIRAMLDVTVKDIDGKYALFAEPIVFKYGENANDPSTWNIVLAIGKYGDGTQHSKNDYFLIDIAGAEREIEAIKQELSGQQEEIDRILEILADLEERLSACEGKIEVLFDEIERIDTELAKKIEFPDLKLIYDPKSGPNNDGAIRLEWSGYTYTNTQSIPIRDFIKDAMVREASVIIKEDEKPYLHIVWNDDADKGSTDIPLNMLVDIYTVSEEDHSTDYLRIDNDNILHVNVWNGQSPYKGLATGSQVHDLDDRMQTQIHDLDDRMQAGFNEIHQTIENEVDGLNDSINQTNTNLNREEIAREDADNEIIASLSAVTDMVHDHKRALDSEIEDLKEADNALAEAVAGIPTYDLVKSDELTYNFLVDGVTKTTINIPQDMFVSGGEVKDGIIYIYLNALDDNGMQKYISFPVEDLIDIYTVEDASKRYMTIDGYTIGLNVDTTNGLASFRTAMNLDRKIDDTKDEFYAAVSGVQESIEEINRDLDKKLENHDLGLHYDDDDKLITLTGKDGDILGVISSTYFIKDGMVSNVELVEHSIVITWNTDAGDKITVIPLGELVDIYKVADGSKTYLSIDPDTYELSVHIGSEDDYAGLASYTSLHDLMDIVGSGFPNTTITKEVENLKEKMEVIEIGGIYCPEIDGEIESPNKVGGVEIGTKVIDLSGKTMTEMFNEILFPEAYPSIPTLPSVSISGGNITGSLQGTLAVVGTQVNIGKITTSVTAGKFNAPFDNPAQSVPVYTSSTVTTKTAQTGFSGYNSTNGSQAGTGSVIIGSNSLTWKATLSYGAPTNKPKTSYGNETIETGKTATDGAAIWAASTKSATKSSSVTGVYPLFTNINGNTLTNSADYQFGTLYMTTVTKDIPAIEVPSESLSQQHFMIDYPASKDVTDLLIKDLSGEFISFSAPYTKNAGTVTHTINGTNYNYKRLIIGGSFLGECTYKLVLNTGLNVA